MQRFPHSAQLRPPQCFPHEGILGIPPGPPLRPAYLQTFTSQTHGFSSEAKLVPPTIANVAPPRAAVGFWGEIATSSIHMHPHGKDAAQTEGFPPKIQGVPCTPCHLSSAKLPWDFLQPGYQGGDSLLEISGGPASHYPPREPVGTARVAAVPRGDGEGQGSHRQAPASPPMRAL